MSKKSIKKATTTKAKASPAKAKASGEKSAEKAQADQGPKVQVRLKKHCALGNPGDLVEVTAEQANQMTTIRHLDMGGGELVPYSIAEHEGESLGELPVELMTSDEMAQQGRKNVVQTPIDPAFDTAGEPESEEDDQDEEESEEDQGDDQDEEESEDPTLVDGTPQE